MNNEPVAYINIEDRKLEWAKPTEWKTPISIKMDKIPLYTHSKLFTDEEVDAIYSAMGDFADYGDEETELANSIRNKLS
jgi:hypothetical protein